MDVKEFETFLKSLSGEKFVSGNCFFYQSFSEVFWADNTSEGVTAQIIKPVYEKRGYTAEFEISEGELTIHYFKDEQEILLGADMFGEVLMENFFIMSYISLLAGSFVYNFIFSNTF